MENILVVMLLSHDDIQIMLISVNVFCTLLLCFRHLPPPVRLGSPIVLSVPPVRSKRCTLYGVHNTALDAFNKIKVKPHNYTSYCMANGSRTIREGVKLIFSI